MLPQTPLTEESSYSVLQAHWCREPCSHTLLRKGVKCKPEPPSPSFGQRTHRPAAPRAAAAPGSTRRTAPAGRGGEVRSTRGPSRRTAAAVCTSQAPWPRVKASIWKVVTHFRNRKHPKSRRYRYPWIDRSFTLFILLLCAHVSTGRLCKGP